MSMPNAGIRVLLLVGLAAFAAPAPAFGISYSVDCYGTLEAWRSDPHYSSYVSSCYCPSATSHPVCDQGSSGSGSAGSVNPSHEFSLMLAESFLTAMLTPAPEPKGFSQPAPPPASPNPVYAGAWNKLQSMRLPPDKARFLLGEALRGRNRAVQGYDPGDAASRLILAKCLSEGASRAESPEEASWLLRQGSFALSGALVEAAPGSCGPPPAPPGVDEPSVEVGPSVQDMRTILDLFERKREEVFSAREDLREAKEAVRTWEETSRSLAAQVEAAGDEETKAEKRSAMEEALRMLAESEKLEAEAERFAQESEKAFKEAELAFREGGFEGAGRGQ